jgi:hypothetical protein
MCDVPGYYRPVWFHPGGIVNILSLVHMKTKYHVTYDSRDSTNPNAFCVHKEDGSLRIFQQSKLELYYLDTATTENHSVLAVSTVEHNKSNYTNQDYSRDVLARKVQVLVGRPELRDFVEYLDDNAIPNCPINRQDAINAHAILGRDVDAIKGKTTRRKLKAVLAAVANNLPKEIMEVYRDVTLCIDIMFVNRIPFFLSISKKIHFITAEALDNKTQPSLEKALKRIYGVYRQRGFRINLIVADSELECTRGTIAGDLHSDLNICGEDEHVPEIERCIRTTKERTRCHYNSTPFEHYPPRVVIEMVFLSVFWLNAFPHRLGISKSLSPRTIITGQEIDYTKHCRVQFGQYVQTHEKHNNTMTPRTNGALALRPTGNKQGGHYFYSLMSGRRLHRTHWTELPMPTEVKDRVHNLALRANAHRGLTFTDSDGNDLDALYPEEDDTDDPDYAPDNDDASVDSSDDSDYDPTADPPDGDSDDDDDDDVANYNPDLPDRPTDEPTGVGNANTGNANEPTGVGDIQPPGVGGTTDPVDTPEVDDDENDPGGPTGVDTAGVDNDHADLETYVDGLEAELHKEIAALDDSDYDPEDDDDNDHAEAASEQSATDADMEDDAETDEPDESDNNQPMPRLRRRNRKPSYGHLKGRDGDGSLPTIARPEEFKGGR